MSVQMASLEDLRRYVHCTLCEVDQLEADAFPMTERLLLRKGRSCGIHFCLHGPRSVKYTAIWETEKQTLLFYNSQGERFARVQLALAAAHKAEDLMAADLATATA